MNRTIALLLFLLPAQLFGQQFLDKSQAATKALLKNAAGNSKISSESSTTIAYSLKPEKECAFTGSLVFDDKGKCIIEQLGAPADSCMATRLAALLDTKKCNWTKINENQFVSDFNSRLMLELPPDGKKNAYKLMRMDWTRELYELLMKN